MKFEIDDKVLEDFKKIAELEGEDPHELVEKFIKGYIKKHSENEELSEETKESCNGCFIIFIIIFLIIFIGFYFIGSEVIDFLSVVKGALERSGR